MIYILIAILIIILSVAFGRKTGQFWTKQPIMKHDKHYKQFSIIQKIPPHRLLFPNEKTRLVLSNEGVYDFLNKNFNNQYNINYNYFNSLSNTKDTQNISIRINNTIIGFIMCYPIDLNIDGEIIGAYYTDYLCVNKDNREHNVAGLLMGALLNIYKGQKKCIIFKKEGIDLPIKPIIKSNYYYRDLLEVIPTKIENVELINSSNIDSVYTYYSALIKRYRIYQEYSLEKFKKMLIEKKLLQLFIITNKNKHKTLVIGKANSYILNKKVYKSFEIDLIVGELSFPKNINDILGNVLKTHGYSFYCVPNVAHMAKLIKDCKLRKSMEFYYYAYNATFPTLKLNEFAFNIN